MLHIASVQPRRNAEASCFVEEELSLRGFFGAEVMRLVAGHDDVLELDGVRFEDLAGAVGTLQQFDRCEVFERVTEFAGVGLEAVLFLALRHVGQIGRGVDECGEAVPHLLCRHAA